jgi:hypothetical protein
VTTTNNRYQRPRVETRIDFDEFAGDGGMFFVTTSTDGVGWYRVNVPFPTEEAAKWVAVAIRVGALARFE